MKSALSFTMAACLVSTIPLAAEQREADGAWSRVAQLPRGSEISVTVKDSPAARRFFISSDESGLTVLNLAQQAETIARTDVADITILLPYSPKRDAVKGLVVGAAAYSLIGVSLCQAFGGTASCAGDMVKVAALGGGYMAGVSLAVGAVKHRIKPSRVIYRAP
jgi:hypothetical protein